MLVAAPEFKCGAVGEDAGAEKPSSVPEPLASLRGTLRLGSGQACEAAVATRASVMPATSCRASLGPTESATRSHTDSAALGAGGRTNASAATLVSVGPANRDCCLSSA